MKYLIILTLLLSGCDIARQSQRRDHDINTHCRVITDELDIDCGVVSSKEQHDTGEQKSLKSPLPVPAP
jgi:hypothetical protein